MHVDELRQSLADLRDAVAPPPAHARTLVSERATKRRQGRVARRAGAVGAVIGLAVGALVVAPHLHRDRSVAVRTTEPPASVAPSSAAPTASSIVTPTTASNGTRITPPTTAAASTGSTPAAEAIPADDSRTVLYAVDGASLLRIEPTGLPGSVAPRSLADVGAGAHLVEAIGERLVVQTDAGVYALWPRYNTPPVFLGAGTVVPSAVAGEVVLWHRIVDVVALQTDQVSTSEVVDGTPIDRVVVDQPAATPVYAASDVVIFATGDQLKWHGYARSPLRVEKGTFLGGSAERIAWCDVPCQSVSVSGTTVSAVLHGAPVAGGARFDPTGRFLAVPTDAGVEVLDLTTADTHIVGARVPQAIAWGARTLYVLDDGGAVTAYAAGDLAFQRMIPLGVHADALVAMQAPQVQPAPRRFAVIGQDGDRAVHAYPISEHGLVTDAICVETATAAFDCRDVGGLPLWAGRFGARSFVAGIVDPRAVTVHVAGVTVPVVPPGGLLSWASFATRLADPAAANVEVVAYDADGHELGRVNVP